MQFTTVRNKKKDYDTYFTASRSTKKMVPSYLEVEKHQQEHEKNCFPSIWKWKKTLLQPMLEKEKSGSLLFGDQKMQFTTVRNKKKDSVDSNYDTYLKSEKLVHSQQEHEKNVSHLFGSGKKLVPSYFEPDKHCCSYLEREKSGSLLFGDQKMQFSI